MDNELFQATVLAKLDIIINNTKPHESSAKYFGGPQAALVAKKIYTDTITAWGGLEEFAKACRQRMPNYPESKLGLIGAWDEEPVVIAFKADYPQLF